MFLAVLSTGVTRVEGGRMKVGAGAEVLDLGQVVERIGEGEETGWGMKERLLGGLV